MALLGGAAGGALVLKVKPQPEPDTFNELVRVPGKRFLKSTRNPTRNQWSTHAYWTKALTDMRESYGAICAYSCHWIPATGGRSIDHFNSKSTHPGDAYEWSNYRLTFSVLNGCKGTDPNVLDPFLVQSEWFTIKFPSLLVSPAAGLKAPLTARITWTINKLHLNDEDKCLKDRFAYVRDYCLRNITLTFLRERAPFLAKELERQGLLDSIRTMMPFSPALTAARGAGIRRRPTR